MYTPVYDRYETRLFLLWLSGAIWLYLDHVVLCSHQSNTTSVFCRSLLISFCSGVTSGKYSMTKLMIDACIADSSTPDCNIPVPTFTEDFVIWGASFSRGQMWLPWRLVLLVQYNYVYCICIGGISFHYLRQTIFFFFNWDRLVCMVPVFQIQVVDLQRWGKNFWCPFFESP